MFKKLTAILLRSIMALSGTTMSFAEANSGYQLKLKANDKQVKMIEDLKETNISLGKMLEIVFPEKLEEIREIDSLYLREANVENQNVLNETRASGYGSSSLSRSGSMIKYFASTELGGREAAIIEYQLVDVDTNVMEGYEIVTFEKSTLPYLDYVSNTEYFEVSTGTYQGKTIHTWLAYDALGHANWYGTNSRTNTLSIIN